ncbi:guanine nucleotide exchange factor-like protein [Ophiocordyceps camponoti-floridani]|uniref:Guanine nucleotide exchange factor-like protein n=1 Tax=Ophiocordyceps camponoti-floridani TaxID=2030778 RepID=A0A8H4VAM3_9HYPO|nr:guanine nucleotide exchange factor-like protein [Ophiocordyceps camponoti-floridani]
MALIGQVIMELYGQSPPPAKHPPHPQLAQHPHPRRPLTSPSFLLSLKKQSPSPNKMLISASSTSVLARPADGSAAARSWDELGDELRGAWRRRLREVRAWTQDMGEDVFRGVLFGEIAGVIGRVVQG